MSKPQVWVNDFVGVGYRYHDVYMNVFPLFQDKMAAFKLWKKTVDWWPDDKIKLRFVEQGDSYWFILYGGSDYKRDNTGFVKKVQFSENYERFKKRFLDSVRSILERFDTERKEELRFNSYWA